MFINLRLKIRLIFVFFGYLVVVWWYYLVKIRCLDFRSVDCLVLI